MKLWLFDNHFGEISVNNANGYIECFTHESELSVDVNDPLNQKSSWCVFNFTLHFLQILVVNAVLGFLIQHGLEHFLSILCNSLWISHIKLIAKRHVLLDWSLVLIDSLSAFVSDLVGSLNNLQLDKWVFTTSTNTTVHHLVSIRLRLRWGSWGDLAWFWWLNCRLIVVHEWYRDIGLGFLQQIVLSDVAAYSWFLLGNLSCALGNNVSLRTESRVSCL